MLRGAGILTLLHCLADCGCRQACSLLARLSSRAQYAGRRCGKATSSRVPCSAVSCRRCLLSYSAVPAPSVVPPVRVQELRCREYAHSPVGRICDLLLLLLSLSCPSPRPLIPVVDSHRPWIPNLTAACSVRTVSNTDALLSMPADHFDYLKVPVAASGSAGRKKAKRAAGIACAE